jgi:hypothetical protein
MALEKVTLCHKSNKARTKTLDTAHAVAFLLQMERVKNVDYVLEDGYIFDGKDITKVKKDKEKKD